jgi:hypothetical protein
MLFGYIYYQQIKAQDSKPAESGQA